MATAQRGDIFAGPDSALLADGRASPVSASAIAGEALHLLTVAEVSKRTGLTRKALRHYERRGLVVPSGRSESGYRLYGREAVRRLQVVIEAKELGLSLAGAELLLRASEHRCAKTYQSLVLLITDKLRETEHRVRDLQALQEELRQLICGLQRPDHQCCGALLCSCQSGGQRSTHE